MDLAQLNKIARGTFLPTKKLSEVETGRPFAVTDLRTVKTKFGARIVASLAEEFQIFLPKKVSIAIINDDKFHDQLLEAANKFKLFITYNGNNVEFSFA